jgi:uncharacterized surface protein with fasciclin (FAS1) repeats
MHSTNRSVASRVLAALCLVVCGVVSSASAADKNLVDTAQSAGQFSTLLKAVETAELGETLKSGGPFTLFAPTDEAFAKLPQADLDALLKDKAKLAEVLKFHLVPGTVSSMEVAKLSAAKTLEGEELAIDATKGVKVGTATVTKTDITASNGVIHVIDTVLMPKM